MRRSVLGTTAVVLLVLAACGGDDTDTATDDETDAVASDGAQPEVDEVIYTGTAANAGNWPVQVGIAEGFFEDFGLSVSMEFADTPAALMQGLVAGRAQVSSNTYQSGMTVYQEEDSLVYVAGGYDHTPATLVVSPDVDDVEDLRGGTCSTNQAPEIGPGIWAQMMIDDLSDGAMQYPDDYDILTVTGGAGATVGAMEAGEIQCWAFIPPITSVVQEAGMKVLATPDDVPLLSDYSFFGLVTTRDWAEEHPVAMDAFLKGYLMSVDWLYDPANKDRAVEILADNADLPPALAEDSYEWVSREGYPRDGLVTMDELVESLEISERYDAGANLTPDDLEGIIEDTYVRQAYDDLVAEGALQG